ncbi:FG-GAP repeat domain-containing protein [Veronia nyctiphanis]|uniref:FG-GAP repeat domain-containing protein n=1 Tax=Veronia nyctiphanis TaxID=1278244 RepID=UPI001375DFFD|nr:VCBS repeat-containing protein [Veronia nyctiphanis]
MIKYFSVQRVLLVLVCVLVFGLGLQRHWPEAFNKLTASIPFPVSNPAPSGTRLPASPVLPVFVDRTLAYGLFHRHQQNASGIKDIADSLAGGACVFDVDQDGWQDLFIIGGSGARELAESHGIWQKTQGDALFRNIDGQRFELLTTYQHQHSMGCAVGDLNQDGREDLIVSHRDGLSIYENQPSGLSPAPYRTATKNWYTNVLLTDINHDGLVDIYASGFVRPDDASSELLASTTLGFDLEQFEPAPNLLLVNHGGLIFTDQTADYALRDASGLGLSALSWDINHDANVIFIL